MAIAALAAMLAAGCASKETNGLHENGTVHDPDGGTGDSGSVPRGRDGGDSGRLIDSGKPIDSGSCSGDAVTPIIATAGTAHGSGTVTALLPSLPIWCRGGDFFVDGFEHGFSFVFDDGVKSSLVKVGLPWNRPVLHVGQKVSVEANWSDCSGSYTPTEGSLVVRDEQGTLLIWIDAPEGAPPAEISLEDHERCVSHDGCGASSTRDFRLSIDGESAALHAGITKIGGYAALYDGWPEYTVEDWAKCPSDMYVRTARLAVVRGDPSALSASPTCGGAPCSGTEYCALPPGADCSELEPRGVCKPRPTTCPDDYDPVTTCVGYDKNACIAEQAGRTVTGDGLCAAMGTWSITPGQDPGTCNVTLGCGGDLGFAAYLVGTRGAPSYEMRCRSGDGGGATCDCLRNGANVKSVSLAAPAACSASGAVSVCGFAPFDGPMRGLVPNF